MNTLLNLLAFTRQGKIGVRKLPSWRPDLKVWHRLLAPLIGVVRLTVGNVTKDLIKCLAVFCRAVYRINRTQGLKGLCLWLKTAQVLVMQSLPGSLLRAGSREIGKVAVSRTRDGLPRVIPKQHRARMRRGDPMITRLWLTLFGLYRVLMFPGKLKLSTITDPGPVISSVVLRMTETFIVKIFVRLFEDVTGEKLAGLDPRDQKPVPLPLSTSGSNSRYGISSFGYRDVAAWAWTSGQWGNSLWEFLCAIGAVNHSNAFWYLIEETKVERSWKTAGPSGRLSLKEEPAGKVRVFAIVDYWTQCALKPLHELVMGLLGEIPQDGTFDQAKPIKRLLKTVPKGMALWSLDLSAATDRCPIAIQKLVVAVMFGQEYAEAWAKLLVDRPYRTPHGVKPRSVKYARGQPMGAYSSWAIFSLTHHMIVQMAAWLSGYSGWYPHYALLGDDVVIAGDKVVKKYKAICRWFGMDIGLAKSMGSSKATCEFAKRVYLDGTDISGFPWKLWSVSRQSLAAAVAVIQRATGIPGNVVRPSTVALAFGAGMRQTSKVGARWENISRRLRSLLVLVSHPSTQTGLSRPTWLDWLSSKGPMLPVKYGPDVHSWVTPWVTGLYQEFCVPARKRFDDIQAKLFFPDSKETVRGSLGPEVRNPLSVPDAATRAIESTINTKVLAFESSLDKAEASLKHLQKLNIKLRADQVSHVFTQVVRVLEERAAEVPRFPDELLVSRPEGADERQPVTQVVGLWERWRALAVRSQVSGSPSGDQAPEPSTSASP